MLAVAAQAQTVPPGPVIRVPVRLVTAPTLVFSADDRLVFGLDNQAFQVFDNDHAQTAKLDADDAAPVSVVVAVEVNQDVRGYAKFIARVGSTIEALLVGATGEAAVIQYGEDIKLLKPFESGDVQLALRHISAAGRKARAVDAGLRGIAMLRQRSRARGRVLLYIGQPVDNGSESSLEALREEAEAHNITVYALTLPEAGKEFASDTFSLEGLSSRGDRGGFKAGVDLGRLVPVLHRSSAAAEARDPFSVLTAATGGTQFHFRQQRELEDGISLIGVELRSAYVLSYSPIPVQPGYHTIRVQVGVPGAKVYTRPGYYLGR